MVSMPEGQAQKTIARLNFFLAQVKAKEDELRNLERQFHVQLKRLPNQAIYGPTNLDVALSVMAEVEERLVHVQATLRRLQVFRRRAQQEIDALRLTVQVEEAKEALAALAARPSQDAESAAEMRRLHASIEEYSQRAAALITGAEQTV